MQGKKPVRLLWQILIVVLLTGIGKLGAFFKDVLLSFQFGAGPQADAYFIANAIPGFVFTGVFATIGLVFLPIYQKAMIAKSDQAGTIFATSITCFGIVSLLVSLATMFWAKTIVTQLAPYVSADVHDLAVTLTQILAVGFVFSGFVGLQSAVLQANKSFILPQVVPVANHIFVITGLVVAYIMDASIIVLVVFAVGGWVLLTPLSYISARQYWPSHTTWSFDTTTARSVLLMATPVFLSLSLDQANLLIGVYLGSAFDAGSISHLNYANRLLILFSAVFGIIISYFIFPYLNETVIQKQNRATTFYAGFGVVLTLAFTVPLAVFCLFFSHDIVSLAFQRGAFSISDVVATAGVLQYFSVAIVFIGLREVVNRIFLAQNRMRPIMVFSLLGVILNFVTSVYFSKTMGLSGIAIGTSIGATVYVIAQVFVLYTSDTSIVDHRLQIWVVTIIGAGIPMIGFIMVAADAFDNLPLFWALLLKVITSAGIYYLTIAGIYMLIEKFAPVYRWVKPDLDSDT